VGNCRSSHETYKKICSKISTGNWCGKDTTPCREAQCWIRPSCSVVHCSRAFWSLAMSDSAWQMSLSIDKRSLWMVFLACRVGVVFVVSRCMMGLKSDSDAIPCCGWRCRRNYRVTGSSLRTKLTTTLLAEVFRSRGSNRWLRALTWWNSSHDKAAISVLIPLSQKVYTFFCYSLTIVTPNLQPRILWLAVIWTPIQLVLYWVITSQEGELASFPHCDRDSGSADYQSADVLPLYGLAMTKFVHSHHPPCDSVGSLWGSCRNNSQSK